MNSTTKNSFPTHHLLKWYMQLDEDFPWKGEKDPYRVLVSEVMLHQTRMKIVVPYYNRWIHRFPDFRTCAFASESELTRCWEGLGYYRRPILFKKACRIIANDHKGIIPDDFDSLIKLPGVGKYTASVLLSMVYKQAVPVLDGNVKRVLSRVLKYRRSMEKCEDDFNSFLSLVINRKNPWEFNQAIMSLGRLICTHKNPTCNVCPIRKSCTAFNDGEVDKYPIEVKRKKIPHYSVVIGLLWKNGKFFIQRRVGVRHLSGLWEFPGGKVVNGESDIVALKREIKEETGYIVNSTNRIGKIHHTYSHFQITMHAFHCKVARNVNTKLMQKDSRWIKPTEISSFPFPKANHKLFEMLNMKGWNPKK